MPIYGTALLALCTALGVALGGELGLALHVFIGFYPIGTQFNPQ